jgi:hypothetical protein
VDSHAHNASGSPTRYSNPSQYQYFFPAYDPDGNPYVDGLSCPTEAVMISELPPGKHTMHTVNYSGGTIHFPGGVNWDRVNGQLVINGHGRFGDRSTIYAKRA